MKTVDTENYEIEKKIHKRIEKYVHGKTWEINGKSGKKESWDKQNMEKVTKEKTLWKNATGR